MRRPLSVDINGSLSALAGKGGLSTTELLGLSDKIRKAHGHLFSMRKKGELPYLDLPTDDGAAQEAVGVAKKFSSFDDLLVLGIGGSSLGPKALFRALCHPFHNALNKGARSGHPRIYFPDNSDPDSFGAVLDVVDLKRTAVAAITKSGGTAETWAQLLVLRQKFAELGLNAQDHFVAITDPSKGALRKVAEADGLSTLPVPPGVGGRFSVLTAVGLFPAAAAGIDVTALLKGAANMVVRCDEPDLKKNPAALLASVLYLFDTQHKRPIHVLMPYADALRETASWFVQLWAESLGKSVRVGPTPLGAVGSTDQHSLLQLLMEGPEDKVTTFIAVGSPKKDLPIPKQTPKEPDVAYLGGHSFFELLSAEQKATASALARASRPTLTLRIPALDAESLGELLMLLEITTSFAGELYGVNAYDQPGVEAGKRYACGLLGRPGYEDAKADLDKLPQPQNEWIL